MAGWEGEPAAPSRIGNAFPRSTGLHGYIRDANTGSGLSGYVYLYDANDPEVEHDAYAGSTGHYTLTIPMAGSYDVYVTMIGYQRVDSSIVITAGETARLDFELPAPIMSWAPTAIQEIMSEGESQEITLISCEPGQRVPVPHQPQQPYPDRFQDRRRSTGSPA